MPYISNEKRKYLNNIYLSKEFYSYGDGSASDYIRNSGELNYVITQLCKNYFYHNGGRYQHINDIIGALECCKMEFYRRLAAPYEDKKIIENGDVY